MPFISVLGSCGARRDYRNYQLTSTDVNKPQRHPSIRKQVPICMRYGDYLAKAYSAFIDLNEPRCWIRNAMSIRSGRHRPAKVLCNRLRKVVANGNGWAGNYQT